jgi:peptide/nickel transport system substrate-binding protein
MGAAQVLTVDPIKLTQGVDNWAITHVFDLLARPPAGRFATAPSEYVPELAESWTFSPDARTWSFKLREGVQFHKGYGECTADDVKFTFTASVIRNRVPVPQSIMKTSRGSG